MIVVDTSAWVEYDRGTYSPVDRRVIELIGAEGPIAVTEPIVMEVLVGATTDLREGQLRSLLARWRLLPLDVAVDFDEAVRIYRACRRVGVTPRGIVDCVIAAVAIRHRASLLASDADLVRVAGVVGIDLDPASGPL